MVAPSTEQLSDITVTVMLYPFSLGVLPLLPFLGCSSWARTAPALPSTCSCVVSAYLVQKLLVSLCTFFTSTNFPVGDGMQLTGAGGLLVVLDAVGLADGDGVVDDGGGVVDDGDGVVDDGAAVEDFGDEVVDDGEVVEEIGDVVVDDGD